MSDVDVNALSQAPASAATPTSEATSAGVRAGGGRVMRLRLPKTTGQMAGAARAAPEPAADTAALSAELGIDGEESAAESAATPPAPPPADDPFGLHLEAGDGASLPSGLRGELEAATGASLGDVTVNAGEGGARTADAHGARAVAEGKSIAFADGEYQPNNAEGRALIAHEVAHTVQQTVGPTEIAAKRGQDQGDDRSAAEADADDFAVAFAEHGASAKWRPRATAAGPLLAPRDKETVDRDRKHFTEATRGSGPVTAPAYLQFFRRSLMQEVGRFLLTRRLSPGHADLRWIEGWQDFVAKLGQLLDVGDGRDLIMRLEGCLAGNGRGSIYEIVDRVRPISDDGRTKADWVSELTNQPVPDDGNVYNDGKRGPRIWEAPVGTAVGEALEQVLRNVMPTIAAQYVAIAERNRKLAIASGEFPAEVKHTELIPGHPLAWYVARAFAESPACVEPAGGKLDADPDAVVAYKKVKEVRWLGPPAPWNAVEPVKPAKTSAEAMATRFLGSPTEAHRIKQVGAYFLIPEEVAATIPEAARHRPKARKDAPPADDVHALAMSALGDAAGAAEAETKGAKAPEAGELVALWTEIDKKLRGLVLATAKLPGQAHVASASARHTTARLGLDSLGPEAVLERVVVYRAQLDLLTQIAEDVGALAMHIDQQAAADPWADKVSAGQKARLTALLRAASLSHLPDTGKAALDEARALEQTQVLDTLDALFADAVARVEAARHVKDDAKNVSKRSAETFGATLPDRRDRIRVEMANLRTKLRLGTASPEAVQRLIAKVDGFRFEAMVVANYGAIQQVMVAVEKLEESDWVAAVGKIDNLEDIRGAGNRFRMGLSKILSRWLQANKEAQARLARIESKGGDPDLEAQAHALVDATLAELRAKLGALGDDEGIQAFLRHAYDEIDDAQTKAAILQVATIIGVTIIAAVVSGGVGSAVGGAAAGGVGEGLLASSMGILAESATMFVATTLLNGGDFGEAFAVDMAQNVAMLSALKGFDSVFRATRLGAAVGRGAEGGKLGYYSAKGVELTGRSVVMAGVMLASAEVESLRKQGRTLSTEEIQAQGAQGIAQVIGTAVLNRLAKTPMAQLKALGARGGALVKQHANLMVLARQVKKSKGNPALALDLLRQERAHLEAELALYTDLSTKTPAELHRMGLEPEVVKAMLGSTTKHLGGLDQLEGGTLPAQLGLETVVPGRVYEGSQAQVAKVLGSYRKPGVAIETHTQADGSIRYRVLGPDGSPVELIAKADPAAKTNPASKGDPAASHDAPRPDAPKVRAPGEAPVVAAGTEVDIYQYADRVPPIPGMLDVVLHGTKDTFYFFRGETKVEVTHGSLALYILKSGRPFERIRLISCETGAHTKGAAQHLANKLGVDVYAPTDKIHIGEDGSLVIGPKPDVPRGTWAKFEPAKSSRRYSLAKEPAAPDLRERLRMWREARAERRGDASPDRADALARISDMLAGVDEVVPGQRWAGSGEQIATAVYQAREAGMPVRVVEVGNRYKRWRIDGDDGRFLEIEERTPRAVAGRDVRRPRATGVPDEVRALLRAQAAAELGRIRVTEAPTEHSSRGYLITREDGHRLAELLPDLDGAETIEYRNGLLVRLDGKEWYFEFRDQALAATSTRSPRTDSATGLPEANVGTIEIYGYLGVKKIDGRTEWTDVEKAEVKKAAEADPLIRAGHIAISFDGGKTLYGFTPEPDLQKYSRPDGTLDVDKVVKDLRGQTVMPGRVKIDNKHYYLAEKQAREKRWDTEVTRVVVAFDVAEQQAIVGRVLGEEAATAGGVHPHGYTFPPKRPTDGSPYVPYKDDVGTNGQQYPADCIGNCAVWPRMVGVPIPEQSGRMMEEYMPELKKWESADAPIAGHKYTQDTEENGR